MSFRGTIRLFDGYRGTSPDLHTIVHRIQSALVTAGFPVKIDGKYGPTTEEAVRRFQEREVMDVDGIVGPMTWARLMGEPTPTIHVLQLTRVGAAVLNQSSRPVDHVDLAAHYRRFREYRGIVDKYGPAIPRALIFGIGSRESGWGGLLKPVGPAGTGDGGHGRGLMQIDDRTWGEFCSSSIWKDPAANIAMGVRILTDNLRQFAKPVHPRGGMSRTAMLSAALAAYNCGPGRVLQALREGLPIDHFTAGRNYSADVLDRTAWCLEKERQDGIV